MNWNRLYRKITKDLARNKAKSAVLGLMCLVAMYYWVPILWEWIDAGSTTAETPLNEPPTPVSAAAESKTTNVATRSTSKQQRRQWSDVLHWMEKDPNMLPAILRDDQIDPFRVFREPAMVEPANDPGLPIEIASEVSPVQLGLVLNSTIVGQWNRVAKINGVQYREKSKVVVGVVSRELIDEEPLAGKRNEQVEFELAEVHPHYVVLIRDGKSFPLTLARPNLEGRERILFQRASVFERLSDADREGD